MEVVNILRNIPYSPASANHKALLQNKQLILIDVILIKKKYMFQINSILF
jgi:hypothetical protein